jgi:uncharacterized protein (TIGR02271 family)
MDETYGNADTGGSAYGGSRRTMTAFFDDQAAAERAVEALRAAGITDASLSVTGGEEFRGQDYGERGFWDAISDFFFPDEDRAAYSEGLRRGGYLVTVREVPDGLQDRALDILDDEGAVDLEERTASWRAEGWTGTAPATATAVGSGAGAAGAAALGSGAAGSQAAGSSYASAAAGSETAYEAGGQTGDEEVIPVVEERLRVGKRDVSIGRVRVRSYIVEEPISEEVRLRSERVDVERRPVDRPLAAGEAAFTDRTLEAEERAEEAVVSKDARVTEEVALRRESEERTETVEDSVRRTEVEVEDERGNVEKSDPLRRGA